MPSYRLDTPGGAYRLDADHDLSPEELQQNLDELTGKASQPERTWGQTLAGGAVRIGSTVAGTVAGGIVGAPVVGAMAGAGLGDVAARYLTGEEQDPKESLIQAGLAAFPATPLAGVAANAATTAGRVGIGAIEGAAQGALQTTAHSLLSEGDLPDTQELAGGTLGGAAFGGVAHGVFGKVRAPVTPTETVEHAAGHQIMGETAVSPPVAMHAAPDAAPVEPPPPIDPEVGKARIERMIERVKDVHHAAPPEQQAVLEQTIRDNADAMLAQTRGQIPLATIEGMATKIDIDPEATVPPGTAVNTEHLAAQRDITNVSAARVVNAKAALDLDPQNAALQSSLQTAWTQAVNANLVFEGYASEYGRGLGYLSHLRRKGLSPEADQIARLSTFAKGVRKDVTAQEISAAIARAGDDPNRIYRELINLGKPTFPQRFRGYFLANLLTGPLTIERNGLGNLIGQGVQAATKPAAVGLDFLRSALTGQERTTHLAELPAMAGGARKAVPDAYRAFFQIMKQGFTNEDAIRLVDGTGGLKGEMPKGYVEAPGPLKVVSRVLDATDRFFKLVAVGAQKDALAIAEATKVARAEKLTGKALTKRIAALAADYSANPDLVPGMTDAIEKAADRSIFREKEGGQIQKWLRAGSDIEIKGVPVGAFVMPFVTTPLNIMRQGFQMSPVGLLMKGTVMGGREGAQRIAETALGTLMLGGLVKLAVEGRLSGSAPSDPGPRDAALARAPENSIKFGDTWYRFTDLGPLNVVLSSVANFHEAFRRAGKTPTEQDAVELFQRIQHGLGATGKSLFQQSFFTGFADIIEAATDESGDKWARYLSRRVTSLVPFQGIGRAVNNVIDPTQRRPVTAGQAVAAAIPGLSSTVPARLDAFGRPMAKESTGARSLLVPEGATRPDDAVRNELGKYGITPAPARSAKTYKMGTRTLVVDEASDRAIKQAKGALRHAALERTIASAYYAQAPPATQERLLRSALEMGQTDLINRAKARLRQGRPFTVEELLPPFARPR